MWDLLRPSCMREVSAFDEEAARMGEREESGLIEAARMGEREDSALAEAARRDEREGLLPRLNMAEDDIEAVSSEYKLGTWEERLLESNDEVEPVDMFAVSMIRILSTGR